MKSCLTLVLIGILGVVIVGAASRPRSGGGGDPAPPKTPEQIAADQDTVAKAEERRQADALWRQQNAARIEAERISLTKYLAIKNGMTYAQVAKILGRDGTEQASGGDGAARTVIMAWSNPPGIQNMNVTFQNGRVIGKAQFGLE